MVSSAKREALNYGVQLRTQDLLTVLMDGPTTKLLRFRRWPAQQHLV